MHNMGIILVLLIKIKSYRTNSFLPHDITFLHQQTRPKAKKHGYKANQISSACVCVSIYIYMTSIICY